jgi:hypothetical protein
VGQQARPHVVDLGLGVGIGQEVTQFRPAILADVGRQRDGIGPDPHQVEHPVLRKVERFGQFGHTGRTPQGLLHLVLGLTHAQQVVVGARRQPHRGSGGGDAPGDELADPPHPIGGEPEALVVIELLHRTDQAQVAFLHQVQQRQPGRLIALGDRHHQTQVGVDEVLAGPFTGPHLGPQTGPLPPAEFRIGIERCRRQTSILDGGGQLSLPRRGQKVVATDFVEVGRHRI